MAEAQGNSEATAAATAGASAAAPKKKHQDVETHNLEKVTDFVEEAENSEELGKVTLTALMASSINHRPP